MSTPEYADGVTEFQKGMQDSLNKELAERKWQRPLGKAMVDKVVHYELLRGNRNQTRWDVVTDIHTIPPRIRLHPYALPGNSGRNRT